MRLSDISANRPKPVMVKRLRGSAWAWQACLSCSSSSLKINYRSAVCCGKAGGKRGLEMSCVPFNSITCKEATFVLLKYSPISHVFHVLES